MNKVASINNKKLFYRIEGNGPCVVLLHGFGEEGSVWEPQLLFLQKDYQVIVPDLPGSGQSDMVEDMSLEGLATSVQTILLHENVSSCVVIGHSMGGFITLAFAEKFGERLKGFGLFHSSAYADTEEKKAARKKGITFIEEQGGYEFLKTLVPSLYGPVTREKNMALINHHLERIRRFPEAALIAYYRAMMQRPARTELLTDSHVPVLFVLGKYDTATPLGDSLQQCHLPDTAFVHILQQSGHMGMREEPEKSNAILKNYLSIL